MAKIDRDAAVAVLFHRYEQAAQRWKESGEAREFGAMIELDRAGLELSRLPAEEDRPAFRWVPLSEALPEADKEVLITLDNEDVVTGWRDAEEDGDWWIGTGDSTARGKEVTAWAPLPDPYEEEQDDAGAD